MSDLRAKHMEGTPVDTPHALMLKGKVIPLPNGMRSHGLPHLWMYRSLVDSLLRVSIGNPPRGTLEGPITNMSHEINELDMGPCQCLYCLQLDVVMVQDPSRPPPPQHSWTAATIRDMVAGDAPNIKDCIILSQGSACPVLQSPSGAPRRALPA